MFFDVKTIQGTIEKRNITILKDVLYYSDTYLLHKEQENDLPPLVIEEYKNTHASLLQQEGDKLILYLFIYINKTRNFNVYEWMIFYKDYIKKNKAKFTDNVILLQPYGTLLSDFYGQNCYTRGFLYSPCAVNARQPAEFARRIKWSNYKWNIPDIFNIENNIRDNIDNEPYQVYVQQLDADSIVVRFYSSHYKEEFSRILVDKRGIRYYYKVMGGWQKTNRHPIDIRIEILNVCGIHIDNVENTRFNYYFRHYREEDKGTAMLLSLLFPAFENILNIGYWPLYNKIYKNMHNQNLYYLSECICDMFGSYCFKEKSFKRFVNIPQFMVDFCNREDVDLTYNRNSQSPLLYITFLKSIDYSSDKLSIDKKTFEECYQMYTSFNSNNKLVEISLEITRYFKDDIRKIFSYIKKINENLSNEEIIYYVDYIHIITRDSENRFTPLFGWKIKLKDIKQKHDEVLTLKNIYKKDSYDKLKPEFDKQKMRWEKYLYSDDRYKIVYPNEPYDFYVEGEKLHHCVDTYVDSVISGKTDIVFIRKVENPDTPFYTMEICNNKIVQCSGFGNCSIDEELMSFIKNFAKTKEIEYDIVETERGYYFN